MKMLIAGLLASSMLGATAYAQTYPNYKVSDITVPAGTLPGGATSMVAALGAMLPKASIPTATLLGGTTNALVGVTIGSGLSYNSGTNTLSATGGGGSGPTIPSATLLGGASGAYVSVTPGTGLTYAGGSLTVNDDTLSQGASNVLAAPASAAGVPSWRQLGCADLSTATAGCSTPVGVAIGDLFAFSAWNGGAFLGLSLPTRFIVGRPTPTATDYGDMEILRNTTFTGGAGDINGALRISGTNGPTDASQEWSLIVNPTTTGHSGGSTVGIFSQVSRLTGGTDAMWGAILGTVDETDLPSLNNGGGTPAVEIDEFGNGADNYVNSGAFAGVGSRSFIHFSYGRYLGSDTTPYEITHGLWFGQNTYGGATDADTFVDSIMAFGPNTQIRNAIDCRDAIPPTGATNPVDCMVMAGGQAIEFNGGTSFTSAANATLSESGGDIVSSVPLSMPTPAAATNSAVVATTAYVQQQPLVLLPGGRKTAYWYGPKGVTSATAAPTAGVLYAIPVQITGTLSAVGFNVTATTGDSYRLGVYADTGSGLPGSLLFDSGSQAISATGAQSVTVTGVTGNSVPANCHGWVWLALVLGSTTPPTVTTINGDAATVYTEDLLGTGYEASVYSLGFRTGFTSGSYSDTTVSTALPSSFGTATPVGGLTTPLLSFQT